ncbi:hypothetical protein [Sphingorhabdus contaminans]|uniref:Uncharacterized protein n=1 Tax=Sphingorhabdus contaminans TaxID=1343899 RepID=A0A553WB51_9SPHN|nr:hypothetical protein [Sphingorhabdus contaminans]TSB01917.1 hypothetical protein FOM92_12205 [Sphingorhabdus contaminans]
MSRKRKAPPRFAALRAKPPLFWVKLVSIAAITCTLAWLSFIHAVANITWQQNPDLALRFVPDHPLALSRKADELFAAKQDPATLAKVEAMAKQSLRGGALNPVAIRLLGYVADARGDRKKAREFMLLSQKVSRRDFGTQLWLIEDAVARNDKKQALYHYDIAMRTTPSSFPLLFPTLTGALDDPEVRAGLAPYVKAAPEWLLSFLPHAIGTMENPSYLVDVLLKAGPLPDRPEYRDQSNYLLSTLANKGQFSAFERYYASLPSVRPKALQTAAMNKDTVNLRYPAAGWQLTENSAIGGAFSEADKRGAFTLSAFAGSGERGELMRKLLFLKPGSYRFTAQYDAQSSAPDSEIRWDLSCVSAKGNSGKWFTSRTVQAGRSGDVQSFTLGADCLHQLLQLQLAGGSGQLGAEFVLRSVQITPVR